jgi:hypothetical protein
MNATLCPGFAYDTVSILAGLSVRPGTLPQPGPGEIIINYGGWSLQELRDMFIGRSLMHQEDWHNEYPGSTEMLPPGTYRLHIPVSDSNRKTFAEQEAMLPSGEQTAPVVLVATAILTHCLQTGQDLLENGFTRCREQTAEDGHVALYWKERRLFVGDFLDTVRDDCGWVSSVRTS